MRHFLLLLVITCTNLFDVNGRINSNCNEFNSIIFFNHYKIILYYKEFDVYKDIFEWNNSEYYYIVDGNKNILFYDLEGKPITFDLNLFELRNYSQKFSDTPSISSLQAIVYAKVLDSEKYDVLPKPLLFNQDDLFKKLISVLGEYSDYSLVPNDSEGVTSFQFDIDENGEIIDAKYFSEVDVSGLKYVVKYLYKMEKWAPAQIDGKPVKSTFEVKLYSRYNSKMMRTDRLNEILKELR